MNLFMKINEVKKGQICPSPRFAGSLYIFFYMFLNRREQELWYTVVYQYKQYIFALE